MVVLISFICSIVSVELKLLQVVCNVNGFFFGFFFFFFLSGYSGEQKPHSGKMVPPLKGHLIRMEPHMAAIGQKRR